MIRKTAVLICMVALLTSGCVYTNIQRPMDTDFHNTDLGSKEGQASNYSILWLVAWGDAGTKAAAENGGISVIKHADFEILSVAFGIYFRYRTVVYGD